MAPVEGTTEVSEVFVEPGAGEDRLGAAGLAGAETRGVVQPADPRTAGGCIEQLLRSAVRLSCQRSPRARQHSSKYFLFVEPTCQNFWTFLRRVKKAPVGTGVR